MKRIAIYGKGGIGKSTVASNITATLSKIGFRVLQIGCDPKQDSTRLLMNGFSIPTVLDCLRERGVGGLDLEEIIFKGYHGCSCIETGGPEPGVGCAGRGILSMFEILQQKGAIRDDLYDMVIYDVLGDVVCGGFAVPLRREHSDVIYIVTSGEFMSLYATNNILKGVRNYGDAPRVGGLICNLRGIEGEMELIDKYAGMVGVPTVAAIPRSASFSISEKDRDPVNEFDHELGSIFSKLSDHIINQDELYFPEPLGTVEMEDLLGKSCLKNKVRTARTRETKTGSETAKHPLYMSKSMKNRDPLSGCAFNGAVSALSQIKDSITLCHGPRSCSQISHQRAMSSAKRTFSFTGHLLGHMIDPPIMSSDMSEAVMIYGGGKNLEKAIKRAAERRPDSIFIVTTCSSGIIGEDVTSLINDARSRYRDITFHVMMADGNISGDFMQGVIDASLMVADEMVDWDVEPMDDMVNIVAEKDIAMNHEYNFNIIKEMLQDIGVRINCRFICNTNANEIRNFNKASLNILAFKDYLGRAIRDYLAKEHGAEFSKHAFPIGFLETVEWLEEVTEHFSKQDFLGGVIDGNRERYDGYMDVLRPELEGKSMMIIAASQNIDWVLEAAFDLGMEIVKVGICDYSQEEGFRSRYLGKLPLEMNYCAKKRFEDIMDLSPDIVLSNYNSVGLPDISNYSVIPLCPDVGFFTGVEMAYRWKNILSLPKCEGWKLDAGL